MAAPVHTTAITIQKGGVDCDSATVYTGTTLTLTAILTPNDSTDPVTWTTSDDSVVTVSNGVLTPVGVGSATITATSNGKQATCAITVKTGGYYVTYTNNDDEQVVLLLENAGEDGSGKTQYHGAISAKTGSILTFNYNYTSIVASKESGANIDDSEGFVVAYGGPSLGLYLKDQLAGNYSLWLDAPVFTVKVDGEVYSTTSRGDVGDNKAIFDISLTSGQKVRINYGYKELQVGNDSEVLEYTASSDGNYIFYINGTYQIWPNTTTNTVVHLIFDFSALSSYSPTCTNHKIHAWTSSGDVHTWASSDELINNNQYTLDYSGTISGLIIMFNQDTQLVKSYDVTPANASYTFEHGGTYRITVNPSGEWYMDNTTKVFPAGITVTKI